MGPAIEDHANRPYAKSTVLTITVTSSGANRFTQAERSTGKLGYCSHSDHEPG
jgi:hypothetical protein